MKSEDIEDSGEEKKAKKTVAKENEDTETEGAPSEGEGVTVPEEFQSQAHELVKGATKPHLNHLRDKINKREDEIRADEDAAKEKKGGKGKGLSFSSEGMPSSANDY